MSVIQVPVPKVKEMLFNFYLHFLRKEGVVVKEEFVGGARKDEEKPFLEVMIDSFFQAILVTIVIIILVVRNEFDIDEFFKGAKSNPAKIVDDITKNHNEELFEAIQMVSESKVDTINAIEEEDLQEVLDDKVSNTDDTKKLTSDLAILAKSLHVKTGKKPFTHRTVQGNKLKQIIDTYQENLDRTNNYEKRKTLPQKMDAGSRQNRKRGISKRKKGGSKKQKRKSHKRK